MKNLIKIMCLVLAPLCLQLILSSFGKKEKIATLYLIGDSTVTDYSLESDYESRRYPQMGWGQVFQSFFDGKGALQVRYITGADSIRVDDRARGGRSTRTFFQEGRWRSIYESLQQGDLVLMQFGHNDQAENKPLRYVNVEGYKEFLRLYVDQTRQKGAEPIILTPVNRNYPWTEGQLGNCHGEYPQAAKEVAEELEVRLIDLGQLSIDHFTSKGKDYVTKRYFMNLPPGKYETYPDGLNDNTHFQPEGARAVAGLVFEAMKKMNI